MPASATTRCCAPIPKAEKFAASWSGPKQCEITGVFVTPDERAMFVGIQHPGETADESPNDPARPEEKQRLAGRPNRRPSALGLHRYHQG